MSNRFLPTSLALSTLAMLTACTSSVPVKDVTANPDAYLRQHFTSGQLNPAVAAKLPKTGAARFGRLTVTQTITSESNDGKTDVNTAVTTYDDNGNGIVSSKSEWSGNGIPFAMAYEMSYRGLLALRTQTMLLRAQATNMIYEVKDLGDVAPFPTDIGATFTMRYRTGSSMQLANFFEGERSCTVERHFPAATLNQKLTGNAVEYACQNRTNNTVSVRSKWVMLEQYGIALQTEKTDSSNKMRYQITDVKV